MKPDARAAWLLITFVIAAALMGVLVTKAEEAVTANAANEVEQWLNGLSGGEHLIGIAVSWFALYFGGKWFKRKIWR